MPNLSLRGLDAATLSRIKATARRARTSVNRLIVETLRREYGNAAETFDDLDELAGSWTKQDAAAFEAATAAFSEVDPALWAVSEPPPAAYRVPAARKRRRGAR